MLVKVKTLPGGIAQDSAEAVTVLVFLGPGMQITPVTDRLPQSTPDRCKLVFADGRVVVLDHSFRYLEALLLGEFQRPGLVSDVARQIDATEGVPSKHG
jgi:hypothetical protein